jgi:hypothetical protein
MAEDDINIPPIVEEQPAAQNVPQVELKTEDSPPSEPPAPRAEPPTPAPTLPEPQPAIIPESAKPKSLWVKALDSIRFRKRAKLGKIMELAIQKKAITNDDVQKLVRVSDATATRYLSELVRQGKLKQVKAGASTKYEPLIGSNSGI